MKIQFIRVLGLLLTVIVVFPLQVAAMELTMAIQAPGSYISPDSATQSMRRSDNQEPISINVAHGIPSPHHFYFIPTSGANPTNITLRFKLSDIPLDEQRRHTIATSNESIYISGPWVNINNIYPEIVSYQLGTGEDDFVEFETTLTGVRLTELLGTSHYYDITGYAHTTFNNSWYGRLSITFIEPFSIHEHQAGVDQGNLIDRWYRLVSRKFPDSFIDGGPLPEYISLENEPVSGGEIEISGENLIFSPTSATSDANGVFGVAAFVDPDSFDASPKHSRMIARTSEERASAKRTGQLNFAYKDTIRKRNIEGHYCEVIMVEGRVTVIGGSGTVKVGDILYPGTRLSLSASYGINAQLGLRFINGTDAQLMQDVYTNACLTDMITIGKTDFTNQSVIQGKTALMSASRYLCEQITGMPNTPEKWARATGKFVVTSVASSVVPGSGVMAYVVKYAVETAAGEAYDYILDYPGDNRGKDATSEWSFIAADKSSSLGNQRVEFSIYHDGSSRVMQNISGSLRVLNPVSASPVAAINAGRWQEFTAQDELGRNWAETADSVDREGPLLRMGFTGIPELWMSRFELRASDVSGLDVGSLRAVIEGQGDQTSTFEYKGDGAWLAEFIGSSPVSHLDVSLADRVGNVSTLNWRRDQLPGPTRIVAAMPAHVHGGRSFLEWREPLGMDPEDVHFYQVRQVWENWKGLHIGPWMTLGPVTETYVDLPEESSTNIQLPSVDEYYLEVRAANVHGNLGPAARTQVLYPSPWSGDAPKYKTDGGTLEITTTISAQTKQLSVVLPPGWRYLSDTGTAKTRPNANAQGTLHWVWDPSTSEESTFLIRLSYPAGLQGDQSLQAHVLKDDDTRADFVPLEFPVETRRTLVVKTSGAEAVPVGSATGHGGVADYQNQVAPGTTIQVQVPEYVGTGTARGQFIRWTGCDTVIPAKRACTVMMNADKTVMADYQRVAQTAVPGVLMLLLGED